MWNVDRAKLVNLAHEGSSVPPAYWSVGPGSERYSTVARMTSYVKRRGSDEACINRITSTRSSCAIVDDSTIKLCEVTCETTMREQRQHWAVSESISINGSNVLFQSKRTYTLMIKGRMCALFTCDRSTPRRCWFQWHWALNGVRCELISLCPEHNHGLLVHTHWKWRAYRSYSVFNYVSTAISDR
jgi:hypothetical protein